MENADVGGNFNTEWFLCSYSIEQLRFYRTCGWLIKQ